MATAIPVYHTDRRITTVAGLIAERNLVDQRGQRLDPEALLNYADDGSTTTNRERVRTHYTVADAQAIQPGAEASRLKTGTMLLVPAWAFTHGFLALQGGAHFSADHPQQLARYLGRMTDLESVRLPPRDVLAGQVLKQAPAIRVLVYAKAVGQLLDLTPFVESLTTSQSANGGNFQLALLPLPCLPGEPALAAVERFATTMAASAHGWHRSTDGGGLLRGRQAFHELLQANDLVFLSFEPLPGEDRPGPDAWTLRPSPATLALTGTGRGETRCYDQIGLVDGSEVSTQPAQALVSVLVSGRDLFKLLIEDGDYFFPLSYTGKQIGSYFSNSASAAPDGPMARLAADGSFAELGAFVNKSIEQCLSFVFSRLAHVRIVPDELLAAWGPDRARYARLASPRTAPGNPAPAEVEQQLGKGIWQIIHPIIDNSVRGRRVVDTSFSAYQGSLINLIRQIAPPPFCEVFGDTYANLYHVVVRRPPVALADVQELLAVADALAGYHIQEADIESENLSYNDQQAYSWYRLMPRALMLGQDRGYSDYFLPAVFFPELAELWGAGRALQVESNLLPYTPGQSADDVARTGSMLQQATDDLRWLVETNALLPFTRRGSITLRGERRYRCGTWVRHLGTGEVFYITAVQQNFRVAEETVERTTTLTVERGMVDQPDPERGGRSTLLRYFRLIDYPELGATESFSLTAGAGQDTPLTTRVPVTWPAPATIFPDDGWQAALAPCLDLLSTDATAEVNISVNADMRDSDPARQIRVAGQRARVLAELVLDTLARAAAPDGPERELVRQRARSRVSAAAYPYSSEALNLAAAVSPSAWLDIQRQARAIPADERPTVNWTVNRANLDYLLQRRQFAPAASSSSVS